MKKARKTSKSRKARTRKPALPVAPDAIMTVILETRGMAVRVAEACGCTRQSIYQWKRVPIERVGIIAKILGKQPSELRPDIFGEPTR